MKCQPLNPTHLIVKEIIRMTRNEFRNALSARLLTLPMSESTKTLDFYDEMICDRIEDGMTEEAAVAALGDIDKLAREILSQYGSLSTEAANAGVPAASAKIDKNNTSNKNSAGESESDYAKSHAGNDAANNTSSDTDNQTRAQSQSRRDSDRIKSENRLLKILIIFVTFPIWITALAIIVSLVFALFAIIWSLVVSILVVVASLVISGVASIGYGVGLFFSPSPLRALFTLGCGLSIFGISLILIPHTVCRLRQNIQSSMGNI